MLKPVVARGRPNWKGRIWRLKESVVLRITKKKLCKKREENYLLNWSEEQRPKVFKKTKQEPQRASEFLHSSISSTIFPVDQEFMPGALMYLTAEPLHDWTIQTRKQIITAINFYPQKVFFQHLKEQD